MKTVKKIMNICSSVFINEFPFIGKIFLINRTNKSRSINKRTKHKITAKISKISFLNTIYKPHNCFSLCDA